MNKYFAKRKKIMELAIQLIAWSVIISAPFFFRPPGDVPVRKAPVFLIVPWIFLTAFYFLNCYFLIPKVLFRKRVLLYIVIVLGCTLILIFIPDVIMRFSLRSFPVAPLEFRAIGRLGSTAFLMLTFIISSSIAIIKELFDTWNEIQNTERERVEAELASLRLQVNPHFLFNTLYNIYYLTVNKSENASNAILKLSDMMRFLLTESQEKFIPLHKEIKHILKYIDLQKLRISDKTNVKFDVIGDCNAIQIAPLILFPFVENAFKYGVSSHEATTIYIGLLISDKMIQFEVHNRKFQTIDEIEKNNIGLNNVTNRLQLIYPNLHKLEIINETKYFNIHLRIFNADENCV